VWPGPGKVSLQPSAKASIAVGRRSWTGCVLSSGLFRLIDPDHKKGISYLSARHESLSSCVVHLEQGRQVLKTLPFSMVVMH
jgi:hypothetical protein